MFVPSNGRVLHVQWLDDPPENGQLSAVVFLHSLGTDLQLWYGVGKALRARGRASLVGAVDPRIDSGINPPVPLLLCDLPGHGLSEVGATPYGIEALADSLSAMVRSLGLTRVVVCGLSVGGQIAQAWAARHSQQVVAVCLAATAPCIGTPGAWQQRIDNIEKLGLVALADTLVDRWFAPDFCRQHLQRVQEYRDRLGQTSALGYCAMLHALREANLTSQLAEISQPTLVLAGQEDVATPPALVQAMAALIPQSRYHVFPGAGHTLAVERPEEFAQQLWQLLEESKMQRTEE